MIDNHLQRAHLILMFLVSTMTVLIGLLFFQYRFFCAQAKELIILKQHYYAYVDVIQRKLHGNTFFNNDNYAKGVVAVEVDTTEKESMLNDYTMTIEEFSKAEASNDPDDDDEYFVEHLPSQELVPLVTTIDMSQWNNDGEQKAIISVDKEQSSLRTMILPHRESKTVGVKKPIKDCGLSWPIERDKFWLSSLYGPRKRINGTWGFHHGIDMAAVKGTVVQAARAGRVVEASFQSGFGNTVVIEHTSEVKTRYAHLHTIRVRVGQVVQSGMMVGTVGDTGFIRKKGKDGSHLHFEVYEKGKRVNPLHCLPRCQ